MRAKQNQSLLFIKTYKNLYLKFFLKRINIYLYQHALLLFCCFEEKATVSVDIYIKLPLLKKRDCYYDDNED